MTTPALREPVPVRLTAKLPGDRPPVVRQLADVLGLRSEVEDLVASSPTATHVLVELAELVWILGADGEVVGPVELADLQAPERAERRPA